MSSDALVARGLTIASATKVLVTGAGLRLKRTRCVGVIGESGSGKTLTLRSLMGLLPAGLRLTAGRVEADLADDLRRGAGEATGERGLRVVDNPGDLCGRGLSMVFQDPLAALDPTMRVGAFVTDVLTTTGGMNRRDARTFVAELFAEVGFRDPTRVAVSFPHQLSHGQRQRVVLAVALASNPSVLLCDEATSALDVTTQAQIVQLLNDLRVRRRLSVVFVTHDLAVARQIADDVVVMFAGRVVEVGDIGTVLDQPRHPYTRTLIGAFSTGRADTGVTGPAPTDLPADHGCPFRRRCDRVAAGCGADQPVLDAARVRVGSACLRDEQPAILWGAA